MTVANALHTTTIPGRLLARNTLINLIGSAVPIVVAVFSLPLLVQGLGTERFGVLTLSWMVVGYFGFFDLGAGRATTKFAADFLAQGDTGAVIRLAWSSTTLLFSFGTVGGVLLAALSPLLVTSLLKIPVFLFDETISSFFVLAVSIPFVLATSGVRGILEAQQRFDLINSVKIPVSAASFCLPLLVLPFSHSLFPITALLLLMRILECVAYTLFCLHTIPGLSRPQRPATSDFRKLLCFGGWLTVSNIIGPFMSYLDRLIVGILMSMTAVTYYATPYDLVMKLGIIPGSLLGVMFPALCIAYVTHMERFVLFFDRSVKGVMLLMAPITLMIIVFAGPLMEVWLGHEFALQSTRVVQILTVGIFINSAAQVPFAAIQVTGRPDLTAKLHIVELPIYLAGVVFLITQAGIVGAALAWLFRAVIDAAMLFLLYYRIMKNSGGEATLLISFLAGSTGMLIFSLFISAKLEDLVYKLLYAAVMISVSGIIFWRVLLNRKERTIFRSGCFAGTAAGAE